MPKPRVVQAGVPARIPEVTNGFSGSYGMPLFVREVKIESHQAPAGGSTGSAIKKRGR